MRAHIAIGVVPLLAASAVAQPLADCRYERGPSTARPDAPLVHVALPDASLFRPLLADTKELRFSASLLHVAFAGDVLPDGGDPDGEDEITAGHVSAGGEFGLWAWRQRIGCDGVQVGLAGGVFSQFNLDTATEELTNTDFLIGLRASARRGPLSARLFVFHQSSHLGDEFLLANPRFPRQDLGFEAAVLLLSYEWRWFRLYGGGGGIFRGSSNLEPGILQAGLEVRGPGWPVGFLEPAELRTVIGVDVTSFEVRGWGPTTSVQVGVELPSPSLAFRARLLLEYQRGFVPFGQFFAEERQQHAGATVQFEF